MIGTSFGNIQSPVVSGFSFGNALNFDGTNDFVEIGGLSDYKFASGGSDIAHSMGVWLYMDDATNFRIASKYENGTSHRTYYISIGGTDILTVVYFSSTNAYIGRNGPALTAYQGQWIYIGWSYDASKATSGIKIYLGAGGSLSQYDTLNFASGTYLGMNEVNIASLKLGVLNSSSSTYANGKMDDFAIWNSVLTLSEFQAIYNAGSGIDITSDSGAYTSSANLTDLLRFDESSGTTATATVGANNGTLNNFSAPACWVAH
jgi:hypothetical protein